MYTCIHICIFIHIYIWWFFFSTPSQQFSMCLLHQSILIGVYLCKQMKLILANLSNKLICQKHKRVYRMKTLSIYKIVEKAKEQGGKMHWNQEILENQEAQTPEEL